MRLHQATSGQAIFDGKDILSMTDKAFLPVQAPDPDHLPEPLRIAQSISPLADPDGADADTIRSVPATMKE
jgi:hypothetical protein